MTHRLSQIPTNCEGPRCARPKPHGEEKLFQAEPTEAKHRHLARPSSMRSLGQFDRHLDCLPGDATNRPRNSRIWATTNRRVANHERQQCIIDLAVDGPQATSGIARFLSDAVQHDRSRLRTADWPVRESNSNTHEESEQSSSRRLRDQFGRGVREGEL